MEETIKSEPAYKSKISFSVESLLSSKESVVEDHHLASPNVELRLMSSSPSNHLEEDEEDEDITVDEDNEDDVEGRDSASPSAGHTVLIPQPLHPSMPRLLANAGHQHQWPFAWVGHPAGLIRSSSPQSKFFILYLFIYDGYSNNNILLSTYFEYRLIIMANYIKSNLITRLFS